MYYFKNEINMYRSADVTHPGEAKGLSGVPAHAFGFLSPKLAIGRNICAKAIESSLKVNPC
jgi:hypothetical protein